MIKLSHTAMSLSLTALVFACKAQPASVDLNCTLPDQYSYQFKQINTYYDLTNQSLRVRSLPRPFNYQGVLGPMGGGLHEVYLPESANLIVSDKTQTYGSRLFARLGCEIVLDHESRLWLYLTSATSADDRTICWAYTMYYFVGLSDLIVDLNVKENDPSNPNDYKPSSADILYYVAPNGDLFFGLDREGPTNFCLANLIRKERIKLMGETDG